MNQDLSTPSKTQVSKHGQMDINPLSNLSHWLKVNGFKSIRGRLERLTGKRLSFSLYPRPITSIHFNQFSGVYIQTDQALFFISPETSLLADEVTDDNDGSLVLDDSTSQHVIAH
jgi:hypothetical protein